MSEPSSPRSSSRRGFLGLCAAMALSTLAWREVLAAFEAPPQAPMTGVGPAFDTAGEHASLHGLDGIDAVALAYLALAPAEASEASLRGLIGAGPRSRSGPSGRRLRLAIERDFREAEVVSLDGWRLSRTEARLAALLHLERGSAT